MGQPILLLVTDQGRVLEALAGDLGRRFGTDYRILGERSPAMALATLEGLTARSEEVALLIAAQRMREMSGVDFIVRAHELQPSAKRVLLVGRRGWTSTNPAVRAMTLGQIDDYLFEPWLPVGRWLYLPITQVLADWVPSQAPSFEGFGSSAPGGGRAPTSCATCSRGWGSPTGGTWRTPKRVGGCWRRLARTARGCRWWCSTAGGSSSIPRTPSSPRAWASSPGPRPRPTTW